MKKLAFIVTLLLLSGLAADVLSGKTTEKGKWAIFYESGSQTVAGNNKQKFQVNSLSTIGFTYGLKDDIAVGLESTDLGIVSVPEFMDSSFSWQSKGLRPGSFLAECTFLKISDFNFKVKLKRLLSPRKLSVVINKKHDMQIRDDYLMFIVSKAVTKKINLAGSLDLCSLKMQIDDYLLEGLLNDLDRHFVRWSVGLDYQLFSDFIIYMYVAHAMDSDAIGKKDEDIATIIFDNRVLADNYGLFKVGLQYIF